MRIGIPTEVKEYEYRVALTPAGAHALVEAGHTVLVQSGAGLGAGWPDADYVASGARIVPDAEGAWAADLVCKIKEPLPQEYPYLRRDLVLFTYLHLAASRSCTDALLAAGTTAIAYETVEHADGALPLLAPMSEVAGRLATQEGAHHLLKPHGGRGVLLGGVPGAPPGKVVVIGAGTAGRHAVDIAVGLRADVTVLDLSVPRLRELDARYGGRVHTVASTPVAVQDAVLRADLVIGAVLVPGARAPRLVDDATVARMRPGAVLVDIAIDQGGCFEGSRPTTYRDPTFRVHDALFFCVANMPGAVPVTSTLALTAATFPYLGVLASRGWAAACRADRALARGLNTHDGAVVHAGVGAAHGVPVTALDDVLR
ncbi:alanine dehydrogenase [Actinotalea fermentans]|uniref:Alanine dehydrogenase n=1 Tax=Actinotalea fermentans TaxID=43671 RepID=A0A511YV72_9CELL|nr:alanine dehydrogenase [Actinotalea fermentans]KGM16060.1 alanine dehydrogenase [Actinotalea fermentans ATCC 43279 = JCM 9966 = DSM 3133]GEN79105.1 alanine dehydrogenase [Actinotalea fermentans]